jgi:biotin carboxyl carrier protein
MALRRLAQLMTGREFHWNVAGEELVARIEESADDGVLFTGGQQTAFRVIERTAHGAVVEIDGQPQRVFVLPDRSGCTVWWQGRIFHLRHGGRSMSERPAGGGSGEIYANIPGKILRVEVESGNEVRERQPLLAMESMKMETTIVAPKAGRIAVISVRPGDVVDVGALLLRIE